MIKFTQIMTAGILLAALLPTKASRADSTDATQFNIKGYAQRVCRLEANPVISGTNASASGQDVVVSNLIDPTKATGNVWRATLNFSGTYCNYAARVTITSSNRGLKLVEGDAQAVSGSGEFLTKLNYIAKINWGSIVLPDLDTAVTDTISHAAPGANYADLVVELIGPETSIPVHTGNYQDTIEINVGPAS